VASAEFVLSIYAHGVRTSEQTSPIVILHSDPTVPDRSALLAGAPTEVAAVVEPVRAGLRRLYDHGCTSIVVCCMTVHYVLRDLEPALRGGVASVLDALIDEVAAAAPARLLMLSSTVPIKLGLFADDPRWSAVAPYLVWPDEKDQASLQTAIWEIKENRGVGTGAAWLESCLSKYGASGFVVGCSEVHVLARKLALPGVRVVDPFDVLARAAATRTLGSWATANRIGSAR
jgi:aspartate racemase